MEVPVGVDEAVLKAAIQAAQAAANVEVHGLTVSAPPGSSGKDAPNVVVEEEQESSDCSNEKEEDSVTKKPAKSSSKAALVSKKPASQQPKEVVFASGWKKVQKTRGKGNSKGRSYWIYFNPSGTYFPSKQNAIDVGNFADED